MTEEKIIWLIIMLILMSFETDIIHMKNAKKSKYENCKDCKNWDCLKKYCDSKKEKKNEIRARK